jgi:hypothetical protein
MSEKTTIDGVDYGPLALLVGTWKGDKGVDKAPDLEQGEEKNLFYETIIYEAIGDVTNAGKQTLAVLRYHQVVQRKSNDEVFHNETGYWIWDADSATVMQSLSIPRGVCVLAGGEMADYNPDGEVTIAVKAVDGDPDWGILQQPFMKENARTTEFRHEIIVEGDSMRYHESTVLDIYGKQSYDHSDINRLTRV